MNKIFVFRGKSQGSALGKTPMAKPLASARVLQFRPRPTRPASKVTLLAMWRRDPKSGRLECRWVPEHGIASEDGASRWQGAIVGGVAAAGAARRASSLSR